jgi:hypothetical protein
LTHHKMQYVSFVCPKDQIENAWKEVEGLWILCRKKWKDFEFCAERSGRTLNSVPK